MRTAYNSLITAVMLRSIGKPDFSRVCVDGRKKQVKHEKTGTNTVDLSYVASAYCPIQSQRNPRVRSPCLLLLFDMRGPSPHRDQSGREMGAGGMEIAEPISESTTAFKGRNASLRNGPRTLLRVIVCFHRRLTASVESSSRIYSYLVAGIAGALVCIQKHHAFVRKAGSYDAAGSTQPWGGRRRHRIHLYISVFTELWPAPPLPEDTPDETMPHPIQDAPAEMTQSNSPESETSTTGREDASNELQIEELPRPPE
ncbi:hypothetical protein TGCAST_299010A, partial [Toxoplasma gondii CAST]